MKLPGCPERFDTCERNRDHCAAERVLAVLLTASRLLTLPFTVNGIWALSSDHSTAVAHAKAFRAK